MTASTPTIRRSTPLAVAGAIATLTGCASIKYEPTQGAPTATLTFAASTPMPTDIVGLWTFGGDKCPDVEKKRLLRASEVSSSPTVSIEAGKPLVVQAEHVSFWLGKACNAAGVFSPVPGARYHLQSTLSAAGCSLALERRDGASGQSERLVAVAPLPDEDFCAPISKLRVPQ